MKLVLYYYCLQFTIVYAVNSLLTLFIFLSHRDLARKAIGASHPEFLSDCGNGRKSEPLDVTQDEVYTFVRTLYSELVEYFPDAWMHVGGAMPDVAKGKPRVLVGRRE